MGKAPEIKEKIRAARDREWVLDPQTGELKPERDPAVDLVPYSEPRPIQAAPRTFD